VNIPRDKTRNQPESMVTWLIMLGRFGRLLFSLAMIGIGAETLICLYISSHSPGPQYKVVPVIPWLPAIPSLAYPVGAIFILCGVSFLLQKKVVVSYVTLGVLMVLCGLAFDLPRHPDLMSAPWRTNVLEPIAIGSLAWLASGLGGIPGWLHRTSRYLLAFALIVFGIAHFQILTPIASMVPGWIPWHRFWTLFFGAAFIAAGLSFATGFLQRWAALGVGLMFALWTVTIHLAVLLNMLRTPGAPQDPDKWSDVFIVAALWGGSWAFARDLRDGKDLALGADSNRA
jgi:putative oxidoreductase